MRALESRLRPRTEKSVLDREIPDRFHQPGGFIAVTCTRRLALTSGLFYGLLAVAGCSDSSSSITSTPKVDGMSPGEYRDKQDKDAAGSKKPKGRR